MLMSKTHKDLGMTKPGRLVVAELSAGCGQLDGSDEPGVADQELAAGRVIDRLIGPVELRSRQRAAVTERDRVVA
jgi:hypothetical protein